MKFISQGMVIKKKKKAAYLKMPISTGLKFILLWYNESQFYWQREVVQCINCRGANNNGTCVFEWEKNVTPVTLT